MEIKLTSSPSPEDMARLDTAADMITASRRFLVSQTKRSSGDAIRASCDVMGLIARLRDA